MNKVVAGRLYGHKIKLKKRTPQIMVHYFDGIPIDRLVVLKMQLLNIEANQKITNGFIRGILGRLFGNTMWISAVRSAKSNCCYLCKLVYRDNSSSTILVDSKVFNAISTRVDIER